MKRVIKRILLRVPWLGIAYVKAVRPWQFRAERAAFGGKVSRAGNDRPSLVYFSHYRCASMMVNRRLLDLISGENYRHLNYQGYVHPWPISDREDFQRQRKEHAEMKRFPAKGHYFGPLRYFVDIPNLAEMKTVVVLRDPRDVLVSRYYSERFNHVRLDKRFLRHCESIEELSLDEFTLQFKEDVGAHYTFYRENSEQLKNALFVNYEEMISDFRGFLADLNLYLGLGRSEEFLDDLASQESFVVMKEDRYSHKRSVEARNFEKKLKSNTIAQLTDYFRETLLHYGWEP